MRRSIELTGLGHRKFYRAAKTALHHRLRLKFDAIPVSKGRYEKALRARPKSWSCKYQPKR